MKGNEMFENICNEDFAGEYFVGEWMWFDFWFERWCLYIHSNHQSLEEAREALADCQKRGKNYSVWITQPVAETEPDERTDPDRSIMPSVGYLVLHPPVDDSVLNRQWF